jgi:hypothetical protein
MCFAVAQAILRAAKPKFPPDRKRGGINMLFRLVVIAALLWISISLWLAHRKGVMWESRFWSQRWPFLHRDEDPAWFYLNLSVGWLVLIAWLLIAVGVLISDLAGINVLDYL